MATFVCLGWGSLIWQPKELPVVGPWRNDGPALRIEFGRQSRDGRITLILDQTAAPLPCLWTELKAESLAEARRQLRVREGIPYHHEHHIGCWPSPSAGASQMDEIAQWAVDRGFDGVVWTALPPKFADVETMPSCDEVIEYLRSLPASISSVAREYITKTPPQISTRYRQRIESELGWTPTE